MVMTYANVQDRVEQWLQDTGSATYDTTELGMWIEEGLKEFSSIKPHVFEVTFKIESRYGTETAGTANTLTDGNKGQFVSTDPTNEKVVHNITDNTWAVVEGYSDANTLTISKDIMDSGEQYEIYNKRCRNKKQIYIGDMPPYLEVLSVEYPLGTRREFKVLGDKIEIDVVAVNDSNSTLSPPLDVDVLVRFAVPHVLSQLTDWAGELTADESENDTTIAIDGMGTTETIEVGEEFHLENHRTRYKVTAQVTMATGAGNVSFYPPLEAAASDNDDITFVKSTLKPQYENILIEMICGIALQSESMNQINAVPVGGTNLYERLTEKGERMLGRARAKLMTEVDVDETATYIYSKS